MKMRLPLVLALVLALTSSCSLFRQSQDPLQRLVVAHRRLVSGAQAVKPGQAERMMAQADEMQTMIEEARAGKPIDVEKADALIKKSYQPVY